MEIKLETASLNTTQNNTVVSNQTVNTVKLNTPNTNNVDIKEGLETIKNMVSDFLQSAGFKVTDQNIQMVSILLANKFPLNQDILKEFNQALKIFGTENVEKALFFLQNEMKVGIKASGALEGYLNHEFKIGNRIEALVNSILELPDMSDKNKMISAMLDSKVSINKEMESLVTQIKNNPSQPEHIVKNSLESPIVNAKNIEVFKDMLLKELPEQAQTIERAFQEKNNDWSSKIIDLFNKGELDIEKFRSITKMEIASGTMGGLEDVINSKYEHQNLLDNKMEVFLAIKKMFPGKELSDKLLTALKLDTIDINTIKEAIVNKFSIVPENFNKEETEKLFTNLKDNLELLKNIAEKTPSETNLKILESVKDIKENLQFASQLKNNIFIQIPFTLHNGQTTGELYVFNDNKNKSTKKENMSALISIDTAFLGHFETYITKSSRNIHCQFRLTNDKMINLVKENLPQLSEKLSSFGYVLSGYNFKTIEEAFTIIDKEPTIEEPCNLFFDIKKPCFDKKT